MSELLRELVGVKVSVWATASSCTGVVIALSGGWLQIETEEPTGKYRLIPLRAVRLIKCPGHGLTAQSATGGLVPGLVGSSVFVESGTCEGLYEDTGVLEAFDEDWVRVRTGKDQLLFGVGSITQLQVR